jgi:hypothetical protein
VLRDDADEEHDLAEEYATGCRDGAASARSRSALPYLDDVPKRETNNPATSGVHVELRLNQRIPISTYLKEAMRRENCELEVPISR